MRKHMKHSGRSARKVISQEAMRVTAAAEPALTGRKASGILASLTPAQVQAMLACQAAAARRMPHSPAAPPPSPRSPPKDDGYDPTTRTIFDFELPFGIGRITSTVYDRAHPEGFDRRELTLAQFRQIPTSMLVPERLLAPVARAHFQRHMKAFDESHAALKKAANYEQE